MIFVKKFSVKDLILMFTGLFVGTLGIFLYFNVNNNIINVIISVLSFLYSIFYMYYVMWIKKIFSGKEKYIFPLIFYIVLYLFIIVMLIMSNPIGDFGVDYYLWGFYIEVLVVPVLYFFLVYFSNSDYRYSRR